MQRVWFEECVGGTSRRQLGLVQSPDESRLADDDTIASVTAAYRQACASAREAVADLPLDAVVTGHRAGPRTLRCSIATAHWGARHVFQGVGMFPSRGARGAGIVPRAGSTAVRAPK